MNNKIVDTQLFMESMEIERIINDIKADNVSYELNLEYYIDVLDENRVVLKIACDSGFKPNLMFRAKFKYAFIIEFENDITDEDIYANEEDIFDSIGSEVSYLIAILTRNMGGSPLIVPPVVSKINRLEKK